MRTTHVLRGEDWLSSVPVHLELFKRFNFEPPKYAHLGLVMIVDENGTKRKISKRKDQDFSISSFEKQGFPSVALQEYLMTIANTNFEGWRQANQNESLDKFEFSFSKVGSNPLFDMSKLINISKNCISKMTAEELYNNLTEWSQKYDSEFYNLIKEKEEYTKQVLNIEREQKKPRKDFSCYSDIKNKVWYMFDEYFNEIKQDYEWQNIKDIELIKKIVEDYFNNYYDISDDKNTWFDKMKELCKKYNFASDMKEYKENPDNYNGNITDIATIIRVAITTSSNTPDLFEILKILGMEKIKKRVEKL